MSQGITEVPADANNVPAAPLADAERHPDRAPYYLTKSEVKLLGIAGVSYPLLLLQSHRASRSQRCSLLGWVLP